MRRGADHANDLSVSSRSLHLRLPPPGGRSRRKLARDLYPPTLYGTVRWLVDGMNLIGTRPDRWWSDRDAAMLKLVDELERWAAGANEDVTVVFERAPRPVIRSTVIEVAHAPRPKPDAADDEIVRRLREDPEAHRVRVVTSDRLLSVRAEALGASVEGSDSFRHRLENS
jgi:predicted RNA-binding protein with PIN domain